MSIIYKNRYISGDVQTRFEQQLETGSITLGVGAVCREFASPNRFAWNVSGQEQTVTDTEDFSDNSVWEIVSSFDTSVIDQTVEDNMNTIPSGHAVSNALALKADTDLGNVDSDLTDNEKLAIRNKIGAGTGGGSSHADDLAITGSTLQITEDGTPTGTGIRVEAQVMDEDGRLVSSKAVFDGLAGKVDKPANTAGTGFGGHAVFVDDNGDTLAHASERVHLNPLGAGVIINTSLEVTGDIEANTGTDGSTRSFNAGTDVHFTEGTVSYLQGDTSAKKVYYDPTNASGGVTTSDDNEIATVGNLSTLADEITAILIERNSAGQSLEQWEEAGNDASTFVADSSNSLTEVSLANNLNLLANDSYSKMIVATENGNNYHFDLLRFQAVNGRLVLQTDNLVTRLANIDTAISNVSGGGLPVISAFSDITSPTDGQDVYLDTTDGDNQPGIYQYNTTDSEWVLVVGGQGVPFGDTLPRESGTLGQLFRLMEADGNYQLGFYVRIANTGNITDWRQLGEERGNGAFPLTNLYDGRTFYLEQHDTSGTNDDAPAWYVYREAAAETGTIGTNYQSAIAADWYVSGESIEATRIYPTLGDTTASVNPDTIEDVAHVEQFEVTPGIWTFDGTVYIYNGIAHDIDTTQDLWDNAPLAPTTTDTYRSGWETWDNFVARVEGGSVNAQATYSQAGVTASVVSAENRLTFGSAGDVASFVQNIGWPLGNQNFEIAAGSSFNFEIVEMDGTTHSYSAGQLGQTTNFIYDTDTDDHISFQTASVDLSTARTGTIRTNLAEAPVTDIVGGTNVTLGVSDGILTINSSGGASTGGIDLTDYAVLTAYVVGDFVYHKGEIFRCHTAYTSPNASLEVFGPQNQPENWGPVTENINAIDTLAALELLNTSAGTSATIRVGDYFAVQGDTDANRGLYIVTATDNSNPPTTGTEVTKIAGLGGDGGSVQVNGEVVTSPDFRSDVAAVNSKYAAEFRKVDSTIGVQIDIDEFNRENAAFSALQTQVTEIFAELAQHAYTWEEDNQITAIFVTERSNKTGSASSGNNDQLDWSYRSSTHIIQAYAHLTDVQRDAMDAFVDQGLIVGLGPSEPTVIPFRVTDWKAIGTGTTTPGIGTYEMHLTMVGPDEPYYGSETITNASEFESWADYTVAYTGFGYTSYLYRTTNNNLAVARYDSDSAIVGSALTPDERLIVDNLVANPNVIHSVAQGAEGSLTFEIENMSTGAETTFTTAGDPIVRSQHPEWTASTPPLSLGVAGSFGIDDTQTGGSGQTVLIFWVRTGDSWQSYFAQTATTGAIDFLTGSGTSGDFRLLPGQANADFELDFGNGDGVINNLNELNGTGLEINGTIFRDITKTVWDGAQFVAVVNATDDASVQLIHKRVITGNNITQYDLYGNAGATALTVYADQGRATTLITQNYTGS